MSLKHTIGDLYHRYAYMRIAGLTADLTDRTRFAVSDLILGFSLIAEEIVLGLAASYSLVTLYTATQTPEKLGESVAHIIEGAALGLVTAFGGLMVSYGLNMWRTPLTDRLGLEAKAVDYEAEFAYTIEGLNRLCSSPALTFEQTNQAVNASLDRVVADLYGYSVPHARRTKQSLFSRQLLQLEIGGVTNPFFQEIVVTTPHHLEAIAHEKSHLVGFARETDAQLMGYIAMRRDPALQYLAYVFRLDLLLQYAQVSAENLPAFARARGLNERTITELQERKAYVQEVQSNVSQYVRWKVRLNHALHRFVLRLGRQGDPESAYVDRPIAFISAFDPPIPSESTSANTHAESETIPLLPSSA